MAKYSNSFSDVYIQKTHVAKLARLLDSSIALPGGFRIGLDGIIGLIPGVGDAISGVLSLLILQEAYKRGVPRMILVRMAINVLIDTLIGAIPILGDIFDFFWKSNMKNVELLEGYEYAPHKTYRKATAGSIFILGMVLAVLFLLGWLFLSLVQLLWPF